MHAYTTVIIKSLAYSIKTSYAGLTCFTSKGHILNSSGPLISLNGIIESC